MTAYAVASLVLIRPDGSFQHDTRYVVLESPDGSDTMNIRYVYEDKELALMQADQLRRRDES